MAGTVTWRWRLPTGCSKRRRTAPASGPRILTHWGRNWPAYLCAESPGTVPSSGLAAGGKCAWKNAGAFPYSGRPRACPMTAGTGSPSRRMVPCGRAAPADYTASRLTRRGSCKRNRIWHPASSGARCRLPRTDRSWCPPTRAWPSGTRANGALSTTGAGCTRP